MSDWLGVIEGVVTAAIPVIGLVYTYNAKVRGQYDQVLAITQQATVPPVADDRHVAGTAFEPLARHRPRHRVRLTEAEIRAVYNVLWYFQRADAMYVSLRSHVRPTRTTRAQELLLDSLASAVATWTEYADFDWVDQEGNLIDAIEALRGLHHLARERARLLSSRGLCESNHLAGERLSGASGNLGSQADEVSRVAPGPAVDRRPPVLGNGGRPVSRSDEAASDRGHCVGVAATAHRVLKRQL